MNGLFDILNSDEFQGVIRHALTTAGGATFVTGHFDPTQWQTTVGALMALIGVLLSVAEKKARIIPVSAPAVAPEAPKNA